MEMARRIARLALAQVALAAALLGASADGAGASAGHDFFRYRGVIEGFYGTPFSHADRMDLIRWESAHGMNIFVDAPKQDPYVRTLWRHQYPPDQLAQIREEIALAARMGVEWVPDVGPGIPLIPSPNAAVPDQDVCFACPADRQVLVDKFRPFVEAGTRTLMVSFDDTVKRSSHAEDAAAYGSGDAAYGAMNADLLDRLAAAFPGVTVLTVPADYSGTRSTDYLQAFAARLDPAIVVMWTGTAVVAPSISGADARAFGAILHRQVVVWDNYPVNDYVGGAVGDPTNIFMGPVLGRGPDLVGSIQGLLANPMVAWQPNKVPLATVADCLADPWSYQPESSWRRAIAEQGGADAAALARLAENTRSSPLGQQESVVFAPQAAAFWNAYVGADWPGPAQALDAELAAEQAAPQRLRQDGFDAEFRAQTAAFLDRLQLDAAAGRGALQLLESQRPSLSLTVAPGPDETELVSGSAAPPDPTTVAASAAQVATLAAPMLADHHNVHGDRVFVDVDGNVVAGRNLMDAFVARAQESTTAWLPRALQAGTAVSVTVNGRPVPRQFHVALPAGTVARVVATDGAGEQTAHTAVLPVGAAATAIPSAIAHSAAAGTLPSTRSSGPAIAATVAALVSLLGIAGRARRTRTRRA